MSGGNMIFFVFYSVKVPNVVLRYGSRAFFFAIFFGEMLLLEIKTLERQ
jgi:hypothetical protein